jgi:transposase
MLEETQDTEEIIERVAALDIGKAEVVACVRVPSPDTPGRRAQEISTHSTMTRSLLRLIDRLRERGVSRVVMEATSDYWKPAFYLLEAQGFDPWLVNAKDVKHLPGRPKTDKLDSVWLCKVAERQMLRPSFVPPPEIRLLRDLTRYRVDLVNVRTAEKNRAREAARGRPDQAVGHRQRHLRGVGAGDDGRADRRAARPEGTGAAGPGPDAHQDPVVGGGVRRALHRPPRVPAAHHARAGR